MQASEKRPAWWGEQHDSAWERIKDALRRDWEQTKADLTDGGTELNQDLGDTIEQALGTQPLPAPDAPTPDVVDWLQAEEALRYGHGAGQRYADHEEWNEQVEDKLRAEWMELKNGRSWDKAKAQVKRGWGAAFSKFY